MSVPSKLTNVRMSVPDTVGTYNEPDGCLTDDGKVTVLVNPPITLTFTV
jgi:hypothetical protein